MIKCIKRAGQRLWIFVLILGLLFWFRSDMHDMLKEAIETVTGYVVTGQDGTKIIALTFDDGPHPIYTPKLLDGLKERGVTATFFVTGANATLYPELIERMQEDGHIVGNHTFHHVQLSSVGVDIFLQELQETNRVLEGILEQNIEYVRPPFGDWNKSIEQEIDMFPVLWDIDPLDWCSGNTAQIVKRVLDKAEDHAIILMHDEYATSVEAALQIVDELLKEGYEFVTVDRILLQ